jgi:hypothetical protein
MMTIGRAKASREAGALTFPNPSRSYDEEAHGVRFWGYDRTFEISFLVEDRALSKIDPKTVASEDGYLSTFDLNRVPISETAAETYSRRRKVPYTYAFVLTDSDF